jgi:predicted dehydrogenase
MKQVKFGIVGAGSAFRFHYLGCKSSEIIAFTAVYDQNFDRAKKVGGKFSTPDRELKPYQTLDEMLKSDIDAVLIMVPHLYHEEIVVKAAEAGKHVLCEKPMGMTTEACRSMIAACSKAGVKFMIAENHRFLPVHNYIHDMVQAGMIGDIALVKAYEGVDELAGLMREGFWKGDPLVAGGGSFMDMGVHKFATIEYVLGARCGEVTAILGKQMTNLPGKAEDNAIAMCRFTNGTMVEITTSFTQLTTANNTMEIYGSKGTILEDHNAEKPVRIFSYDERMGANVGRWYEPELNHAAYPGYYLISANLTDEYFAKCVLNDQAPEFTPEQSMSPISDVLAGYLSAIEKRPVKVSEIEKMADENRTIEILQKLVASIPVKGVK